MGYKTYNCAIAKRCGGCEWLAVPYPIQLRRKQQSVEQLFDRVLYEDGTRLNEIRGMEQPLAYRNKAATPFAPGPKGHILSGFYQAGSHRIVACKSCLVEDPRCREALNAVARAATWVGIPAYNEDRGTGVLRHAVVRAGYATQDILLTVVTNGARLPRKEKFLRELERNAPQVTSIVQNINDRRTNAILGYKNITLAGPGIMHDKLLGCTFEIGPTSFYQTNPQQTEVLYRTAMQAAGLHGSEEVLDAYCGTGTIGICAAAEARSQGKTIHVTGVEQVRDAVACARRNARANKLADACSFVCDDATGYMTHQTQRPGKIDVVIMDPPRAGSTPAFLDGVVNLDPSRIVYVSCNPKTQARDVEVLRRHGYYLRELTPVDMFPHTKHVETVALLSR